jgi:hypothetical protein
MSVANYTLNHLKLNKLLQDQCFIDFYRMSQHIPAAKNNTSYFAVPFNNFHPTTRGELCTFTKAEMELLKRHRLCTSALLHILQRGSEYYTQQKKVALEFGSAKPHGNVGRKRSVDNDITIYAPVQEYFEHISKLAETRATETVRTMTGLRNSTDDIDEVYLPTYMTLRRCFEDYLSRLGYPIKWYNDGNYEVGEWKSEEDKGNGTPLPYAPFIVFGSGITGT